MLRSEIKPCFLKITLFSISDTPGIDLLDADRLVNAVESVEVVTTGGQITLRIFNFPTRISVGDITQPVVPDVLWSSDTASCWHCALQRPRNEMKKFPGMAFASCACSEEINVESRTMKVRAGNMVGRVKSILFRALSNGRNPCLVRQQ